MSARVFKRGDIVKHTKDHRACIMMLTGDPRLTCDMVSLDGIIKGTYSAPITELEHLSLEDFNDTRDSILATQKQYITMLEDRCKALELLLQRLEAAAISVLGNEK